MSNSVNVADRILVKATSFIRPDESYLFSVFPVDIRYTPKNASEEYVGSDTVQIWSSYTFLPYKHKKVKMQSV